MNHNFRIFTKLNVVQMPKMSSLTDRHYGMIVGNKFA